ncbi:MAG TPA: caspase family protein, partial [Gemmatimonadaceae bacterium]
MIGIDQYVAWPRLGNAVSDAIGAERMFSQLGFEEVTSPLLDASATGEALRHLLTDHLAQLTPDDSLVVFFAGHGHTHTAHLGDVSVKTGYLIPVDATPPSEQVAASWLRLDSWLSDVARLPPRHILVIIDACHSGVALESLIKWRGAAQSPTSELHELQLRRSRRIITSALDDQRAMDTGPYAGHSLFTGCLLEGLSGGLSEGGRRMATGSEIGLYLQRRVSSYPMSAQTPDFGAFELDDRGEIVIPLPEAPAPSGVGSSVPVAAQHELLIELGRGGMGVVHLARRADGRLIVVKRLRPELARNVKVRRSFLEEARIAARIKHPSVVEVLGTGFDAKGGPWLEMEWAPGVSLQALTDAAPLPWDLYVAVIDELLAGLHAAHTVVGDDGHTLELVHRDVSPHNVLVTYDGHAKII